MRYLEAFIIDDGSIEINDSLQTSEVDEFHFTKLFPELINLSKNIMIEYEYLVRQYRDEISFFVNIKKVAGNILGIDFRNYAVKLFLLGYERLVKKLKSIPNNDSISILSNLIDDFEEMKYIVEDCEDSIGEDKHDSIETYNYKAFKNAIFKGNRDDLIVSNWEVRRFTLYRARLHADSWLDSIDIMIRKFDSFLNNLELIQFAEPIKKINPTHIAEADNQTRAFYIHFRVQMGNISYDQTENNIKVIKYGKYLNFQDRRSYQEYRKIINGKVAPERIIDCCRVITQLEDVDPAIKSQAKKYLPR